MLPSDQGIEILNKALTAYLEANHAHHVVCSKDEHASGVAEDSIGVLRTSAMMLGGNIPERFWRFVVSHGAYLNNVVAPLAVIVSRRCPSNSANQSLLRSLY